MQYAKAPSTARLNYETEWLSYELEAGLGKPRKKLPLIEESLFAIRCVSCCVYTVCTDTNGLDLPSI